MTKQKSWPPRYNMMSLLLAALLLCYIDRIIVSLAVIEMQAEFGWSDSQKGLVLSTFFIGYLLMQTMGGIISNRFGGRSVFMWAVILWSVFTILTPASAYISFGLLLFARFMLGFGEGTSFPSAYNLIHAWMPVRERARSIAGINAAGAIGTVATLLVAGKIIEAYGWPSVFYLFGSIGLLWGLAWWRMVPTVPVPPDGEELPGARTGKRKLPWKLLLTHPAVLAIYVASICVGGISFTMASWLPSYFVDTFELSITQAGLYSILPWIVVAVATFLAGLYADRKIAGGAVPVRIRKRVTLTGFLLIALSSAALIYASSAFAAVGIICVIFAGLGIAVNGYSPTAAELLPHFGDVLYGFAAAAGSLAATVIVAGTGLLLERTGSYDALYLGMAVLCLVAALVFGIFGNAKSIE